MTLSPNTVSYMDGGGSVVVSVEITGSDTEGDIQTLWVRTPDGATLELDGLPDTQPGQATFTEDIVIPTDRIGSFNVEVWLVDAAGGRSNSRWAIIDVIWDAQGSDWTRRLSPLPYALRDVTWNGSVFIAVGDAGSILTSADGIDWAANDSGTDTNLNAVAAHGPYVVAVGYEIILQSTDDGASWTVKDRPIEMNLTAVAINASQVVVGGYRLGWSTPITMISEDRGDTWQAVDSWPDEGLFLEDLVYHDGMFVGATNDSGLPGAWVTVSSDGNSWNKIAVSEELHEFAWFPAIVHDGSQFILTGNLGAVFTSPDASNWTQTETPVQDAIYMGAAWNGSKLVVAGWSMCGGLWFCSTDGIVPAGLSSTDGGVSWDVFNIDIDYESWGLAWGNGRFVSVGQRPESSGVGAIYTSE